MWIQWLILSIPDNLNLDDFLSQTFSKYVVDDWGYNGQVNGSKTVSIQGIQDSKNPVLTELQKSLCWYRWLWVNEAIPVDGTYSGSHSNLKAFNIFKKIYKSHFTRGRTLSSLEG